MQASPAILIISAMITPALLILGSGSLVATALQRLSRAVDRARVVLQMPEDDPCRKKWAERYAQRALIAERAVTAYFIAVGIFVLDCLSIAVDRTFGNTLTWLPVSLTIIGMLLMLCGAYLMVQESRLATIQICEEVACLK